MFFRTKVFFLGFLGIILLGGVDSAVRNYTFQVINCPYTRLCTTKTMLTVNGQFPGPTIYARRGDLVIVDVINRSDQNITIHWHGVKMPRYPWSDGPNFITQCPIRPGTRFTQRIILSDEEGTLWWHAHSDWTRNSVYGAIIILPPKTDTYPFPRPHAQVPIFIGEWWKIDVQQVVNGFMATGGDPQLPDALLINGQPGDLFPCSSRETFKMRVEYGKTYLIRLVSGMMDYIVFFKISGHSVTVVGTDAAYTKPFTTDYMAISPGQTVDLLLEANQPRGRYYMGARVLAYGNTYPPTPTTGIIEYVGSDYPPSSLPSFPDYFDSAASVDFTDRLRSLATEKHPIHVPTNITKTLFYTLSVNLWPCDKMPCSGPHPDRLASSINNVSMVLPAGTDILRAYYKGMSAGVYTADFPDFPPFPFDYAHDKLPAEESRPRFRTAVSVLEYGAEVEIVFQGTYLGGGVEHPIHLHGYSFYVVGSGYENFDSGKDPSNYNLVDPPLVETVAVPRNGWTAIRFKANNPGVWFMHCHVERHQSWGMKMAFIVKDGNAPDEKMLPPPPDMPRCGEQPLSVDPLSENAEISVVRRHQLRGTVPYHFRDEVPATDDPLRRERHIMVACPQRSSLELPDEKMLPQPRPGQLSFDAL